MRAVLAILLAALLSSCAAPPLATAPAADHHQHVFSPALVEFLGSRTLPAIDAKQVVALLDEAGIGQAVLLSSAYTYGRPTATPVPDERERVRRENDWVAAQAAQFPGRLVAFCGVNPLKDYAIEEIDRCARDPHLKRGLKLHFGNADLQLENPEHARRAGEIFHAAARHGMAIVVHLRASISRQRPYGAAQARIFLEQVLPHAGGVPVQVAHLASSGPGYDDPPAHEVMAVLADAVQRGDPRTRNLFFDVASNAVAGMTAADAARMVQFIHQVGVQRVLYGTDAATPGNMKPREGWAAFRALPLSGEEADAIARNVAPYLRQP